MLSRKLKHFFIHIFVLFVFVRPEIIFSAGPPSLISPSDNSNEDKSPKLIWEYSGGCTESGSCFRVEVDDTQDFSSPEKTTYTNSFSYSPQGLADGTWNWRVKAKDKDGDWSEWSNPLRFTTGTQISSPLPYSTNQPSSTPQPSTTREKPQSHFTIKDIPAEINSDQEFEIPVSLSLPNNPSQKFYIKGAFKKSDSLNYFGFTFSDEWVRNNSSYSAQYKIETNEDGKWDGKIKVKPDTNDSGFDGTGGYVFKVGRYNDSGGGLTWSNEYGLKIISVEIPKPSPSEITEEAGEDEETEEPDLTDSLIKVTSTSSRDHEIKIASVAGEATKSDNIIPEEPVIVLEDKKINWFLIILGISVLAGGIGFSYYKIKKDKINADN